MAKVLVVGGGLAGISSSVFLSRADHEVELIESSPKFGGRAYSFVDNRFDLEIDNGQHIFMGSYRNTFEFLKIVGADHLPDFQSRLQISFRGRGGKKYFLDAKSSLYPINLLFALFKYSALKREDRKSAINLLISIISNNNAPFESENVYDWLKRNNQSENLIKSLWQIICVSALNTAPEESSAILFKSLLKKVFLSGNKSSSIVLPRYPLNELFIEPAVNFFKRENIKYSLSEKVTDIECSDESIIKAITNKREITDFEKIVLAIPPSAISKISCNGVILDTGQIGMEISPIVSIHLRTDKKITNEKFIGLLDSKIHWIFNNGSHYSLVISAADELVKLENSKILEIALNELNEYFPEISPLKISAHNIIKEKRATLKSSPRVEKIRSKIKSNYSNLIFAGDWTNTKLPGTIEGAILSGKLTAG